MPYHVKTPKALGTGDVYWKGNNTWTDTYADRTQFANISYANAIKNTTETIERVVLSNLFSRKAGVVVNPLAK